MTLYSNPSQYPRFEREISVCCVFVVDVLDTEANEGEMAAFIAYAVAFPEGLMCLVDTYDVVR